jgi:hypothetical protein
MRKNSVFFFFFFFLKKFAEEIKRFDLREEVTRVMFLPGASDREERHSFFIHRNVVTKPSTVVHPADDYRVKNARKREISLAIPLIHGSDDCFEKTLFVIDLFFSELGDEMWVPSYSTLCAFLPTNIQTGWKFIVNADFCLVASREGLSE